MTGRNMGSSGSLNAEASRKLVTDFLAAWAHRDLDTLMAFFGADAIYHNVPVAPIAGTPAIREIFRKFLEVFSEISLDVVNIAAEPDLVFVERVDRFALDGRRIELPVNGVFEIRSGKIARFSDYFDLMSFEKLSGIKL